MTYRDDDRGEGEVFIGPDRLVPRGETLVVYAPDMDDWRVQKYRRAAILYGDKRWFVSEKTKMNDRIYRYTLTQWGEHDTGLPAREIVYDDDYVLARDVVQSERSARLKQRWFVMLFYPWLGFLWSRTRARLHEKYGIEPRRMMRWSMYVQVTFVLLSFSWGASLMTPSLYVPGVLVFIDLAVRYSSYFADRQYGYGTLEWVFRRLPEE